MTNYKKYKVTTGEEGNKTIISYSKNFGGMIKQIEIIGSLVTTTYFLEDKNSFGECIQVVSDDNYYSAIKLVNSKEVAHISFGAINSSECNEGTIEDMDELEKYINITMGNMLL